MIDYQAVLTSVISRGLASDYYMLGCILAEQKRWGAAAGCFAQVVAREPENASALANYGWNLHLSGRTVDGGMALRESLAILDEGTANALMSQIMLTLGDADEALYRAQKGVELQTNALNQMALAFAQAGVGDWRKAWETYESRFAYKIPEFLSRPYRIWRGEDCDHLYLEGEQGGGDGIMALRWVAIAAERVRRITLLIHGPLYSLADSIGLPSNVTVKPLPQAQPEADAWCPLLSLPVALDMPAPWFPGEYVPGLGTQVGVDLRYLHIGIAWAGSPEHEQSHHRDCALPYLLRLTEVPGVKLHSLQVGPRAQDLSDAGAYGLILDRSAEITNYLDTAKVMSGLDMVISVDTSVAHLAGAMGQPVWMLMNERGKDFRWPLTGDTTPWYGETFRFFRRSLSEQWTDVVARVDAELRNRVAR